jgi:MarR family transcriptional regulator for hemolysin
MGIRVENEFQIVLSEVAHQIRTLADRRARRHRMSWAQWRILKRIAQQPGLCQRELSAIVKVAPVTVARLVDRIEALGLIKRVADPKDHRIWRLRTTPAAEPALRDSDRYSAELNELILKGVDPAALDAMVIGLRKITENLCSSRRHRVAECRGRGSKAPLIGDRGACG